MALLPSRNYSEQAAAKLLLDVKKGDKKAIGQFVWQNQEHFYSIAYLATEDHDVAIQLTIVSFKNSIAALKAINPKQLGMTVMDWLSKFIVEACADFHSQYSKPVPNNPDTSSTADGSEQMDWDVPMTLSTQRIKRCLGTLQPEEQKIFILRHNIGLSIDQIAIILNLHAANIMFGLFRARVQIMKCLGRS